MRVIRSLFVALLGLTLAQSLYFYPRLPERMASHFDAVGRANNWSSKTAFFALYWVIVVGLVLTFLGLPVWIRRLPPALVNLPHKAYWLAAERRDATYDWLARQMGWLGVTTLILTLVVSHLALQANLTPNRALSVATVWSVLGGYFVVVAYWVVRWLRRFRRPMAPRT